MYLLRLSHIQCTFKYSHTIPSTTHHHTHHHTNAAVLEFINFIYSTIINEDVSMVWGVWPLIFGLMIPACGYFGAKNSSKEVRSGGSGGGSGKCSDGVEIWSGGGW